MRLTIWSAICGVACLGACGSAAPILDITHVKETRLENGLHVVVKEEPYLNLVAAGFCIKASPLYESPEQAGMSDVVRYMLFGVAGMAEPGLGERVADMGGSFDSYTSPDCTQIRFSVAKPCFADVLAQVAKHVMESPIQETVWAQQLPRLRRAIQDARGTAAGTLTAVLWATTFRKHPYGVPVSGTAEGITAFNADKLNEFRRSLYVPNNMSLIVVGDVNAQWVFDLARKDLGAYPHRPVQTPTVAPEPPQTDSRIRLETAPIRGTLISYGWRAAGIANKRDVCTLDVIYTILGMGKEARLVKALAKKEAAEAGGETDEEAGAEAVTPVVEFITKRDPGLFTITAATRPDDEFRVREAVLAEVGKLRDERLNTEELARAKDLLCASYAFENHSYLQQVGSIAFYEAIDSYRFAFDYPDEVQKVTAEDVQRVASAYLGPSNYTLAIIRPRSSGGPTKEASLTP